MSYCLNMTRHEIKLQLSTDLDIGAIKKTIASMEKSGKVKVHWIRSQTIGPVGRPNEVRDEILAHLQKQVYPRSAKQIGSSIERAQTSLYRILYGLVAEGKLGIVVDAKWHTKRFGDEKQIARWNVRAARIAEREAKLELQAQAGIGEA